MAGMNQLLNNRVGKKPKSKNKGCLFLILGTILALLATFLFVFAVSRLTSMVIENRHGSEAAYALMSIVRPCYIVAMILFYGILTLWYMSPNQAEMEEQNRKFSPMLGERGGQSEAKALSKRTLWLITGGMLLGVVLTGVIAINTYRLVTPDGIRTYFFAETGRYEWDDVSEYTVTCDAESGLAVTFTMKGGKSFEILQGVNSATAKFRDTYTSVTHFAADMDEQMDSRGIPQNVKGYDTARQFYQEAYPSLWPYVATLINHKELTAAPDVLPDTTPETSPNTIEETDTVDAESADTTGS